jgi:hypothetical protein
LYVIIWTIRTNCSNNLLNSFMITIEKMLRDRKASATEAINIFDESEPVTLDFMIGRWKGYEIATGHPMDGLLELTGWYGKFFKTTEEVHPLLFFTHRKTGLYSVNPKLIPLGIQFPKIKMLGFVMAVLRPVLQTKKSTARIRMVEYRGKVTGTMAYDEKAIFDHFVKLNENTMLGAMDLKRSPSPYIFVLERDSAEYLIDI